MGSLGEWAQGLNDSFKGLVAIQGMKNQTDRYEKQDARQNREDIRNTVIQGREDVEYANKMEKTPFKTAMPGGIEVENYIKGFGQNLGFIDKDGNQGQTAFA
jgi:hypothetical protein